MIIPKKPADRKALVRHLISSCMASQQDRLARYEFFRKMYLFGADDGLSDYNKIDTHVDKVSSYIYEPGAVRFSLELPVISGPAEAQMAQACDQMTHQFNRAWYADANDQAMQGIVTWSLVFGAVIGKGIWTRRINGAGFELYHIDPQMVGVLREDIADIHKQEVICHQFNWSADEVWRVLRYKPNGRELFSKINFGGAEDAGMSANTLNNLIITATAPNVTGVAPPDTRIPSGMYKAVNTAPMATCFELWIWDDEQDDFQVITVADEGAGNHSDGSGVVIFDRPNFILPRNGNDPGLHPFTKVCPNPLPGYFWGQSEVFGLVGLQQWHDKRLQQIRKLQELQVDPPRSFSGFEGLEDEAMETFGDPGSSVSSLIPGAKIESLAPDMPKEIFTEVQEIEVFFRDKGGLSDILEGKGTPGVRGSEHAALLASFGGSRIKKKAICAEEGLADTASLKWRLMQRYDAARYKAQTGLEFTADLLAEDVLVRIDNHSQAPIFSGGHKEEAAALFKEGALDGEDMLELSNIPGKERLKQKVREKQKSKTQMFQSLLKTFPEVAKSHLKSLAK